jgi:protein-S-isoprenylcysteine O-methyltransferase Ste14
MRRFSAGMPLAHTVPRHVSMYHTPAGCAVASPPRLRAGKVIDRVEKISLIILLGALVFRLLPHLSGKPFNIVFVLSETCFVALVACREATNSISAKATDWLIAFAGTLLPLLQAHGSGRGFAAGGLLMLAGFSIFVGAQLSLRRSVGVVAANRGVKTSGLYSLVRHPMYLGHFCTQLGFLLLNPIGWNACVVAAWMPCQLYRIHAEERLLSADVLYQGFKRRVNYRLLPRIY